LAELNRVLDLGLSDTDLSKLLTEGFGLSYWPGSNEAYRPWLQEVRATLSAALTNAA
jgi:hypothetical protein